VRILVILAALVFESVFLVVSHIIVTPEAALMVSLVLGTIGGMTDYLPRRTSGAEGVGWSIEAAIASVDSSAAIFRPESDILGSDFG